MKRASALLAAFTLAALGTLAVAAPASAHHNEVDVAVAVEGCELAGTSSWAIEEHQVGNTELVVLVDGVVHHALVGTPIDVDLPAGTTEVKWRVWGGGERDYDDPVLLDLAALVAYLDADDANSPLDAEAPGVDWHTVEVADCPKPVETTTTTETTTATTAATTTTTTEAAKLPNTGVNAGGMVLAAIALVAAGIGVLLVARRRRV